MSARADQQDVPAEAFAEAWLARLNAPDCSSQDSAAFEDWLAASPANIEAYLQVERVQSLVDELSADPLIRAAARKARRESGAGGSGLRRWTMAGAAIAATLVAVAGLTFWLSRPSPASGEHFATTVGEQREVTLADHSTLLLDTDSAITTRFDNRSRTVEIERGRVQFQVGHDPQRPFLVRAGSGRVRDIGTTFQVSRRGGVVNVGLIDGAVEVAVGDGDGQSRRALAPGEQVMIAAGGQLQAKRPLDVAVASAWPRGELIFKQQRLDELLAEMNRYSPTQLRLADPALGGIAVSGVFHIGDQAALIATLEHGWSLEARRVGENEMLLQRAAR